MQEIYVKHLRRSTPSPSVYSLFLVGIIKNSMFIPLPIDNDALSEEELEFVDAVTETLYESEPQ